MYSSRLTSILTAFSCYRHVPISSTLTFSPTIAPFRLSANFDQLLTSRAVGGNPQAASHDRVSSIRNRSYTEKRSQCLCRCTQLRINLFMENLAASLELLNGCLS